MSIFIFWYYIYIYTVCIYTYILCMLPLDAVLSGSLLLLQDDKDLVHEFVIAEGLTCLIKVGAEADQNYQNYILRGTEFLRFSKIITYQTII